jgi:hypothetical protein
MKKFAKRLGKLHAILRRAMPRIEDTASAAKGKVATTLARGGDL